MEPFNPMNRPAAADRVRYAFSVPHLLRGISRGSMKDVTHVGLVEVSVREELDAAKRASGDGIKLAFELAREALRWVGVDRAVPGATESKVEWRQVSLGDGTLDEAWGSLHPKIRQLCISAYSNVNNPTPQEALGFLESREVETG